MGNSTSSSSSISSSRKKTKSSSPLSSSSLPPSEIVKNSSSKKKKKIRIHPSSSDNISNNNNNDTNTIKNDSNITTNTINTNDNNINMNNDNDNNDTLLLESNNWKGYESFDEWIVKDLNHNKENTISNNTTANITTNINIEQDDDRIIRLYNSLVNINDNFEELQLNDDTDIDKNMHLYSNYYNKELLENFIKKRIENNIMITDDVDNYEISEAISYNISNLLTPGLKATNDYERSLIREQGKNAYGRQYGGSDQFFEKPKKKKNKVKR